MGTSGIRIRKLVCSEQMRGKSDVVSKRLRHQLHKVEPAVNQGGVSPEKRSLHSVSGTVHFRQPIQ